MRPQVKKLIAPILFSSAFMALTACGSGSQGNSSDLKVTNGIKLSETEYAAVVLLVIDGAEGQSICTGTFVNENQLITAGHCVEGLDETNPKLYAVKYVDGKATGVRAQRFKRNPLYSMQDQGGVNPHDLSVVTFPLATAPAVATRAALSPQAESDLTIVGYGNNRNFLTPEGQFNGEGAGEKRIGHNKLARNAEGFLSFVGVPESTEGLEAGELVASGAGDSGGPMFVNGELVGVTSGGGLAKMEDGTLVVISHYVDLNTEESREFLKSELR